MRHFAICSGQTVRLVISTAIEADVTANCGPGEFAVEIESARMPSELYVVSGAVSVKPQRPSAAHDFDPALGAWVPNVAAAWAAVRALRDQKLKECDWTQLPDVGDAQRAEWAAYRQALRDITNQPDPMSIQWPAPPG